MAGNDWTNAQAGDDTVDGGSGNDKLNGDLGADLLIGGTGNDTFRGGTGDDTFVLRAGDGTDRVTSFQDGHDKFGLTGGLTFAQLKISASGAADTLIEVAATGEDLAVVQGVAPALFSAADFLLI